MEKDPVWILAFPLYFDFITGTQETSILEVYRSAGYNDCVKNAEIKTSAERRIFL
jgi:hypothetical protein